MKYAIALTATLFATTAHADLWTWSKNNKLEPKETTAAYRVPTLGYDVRVYEWSPKGAPEIVCVMAFGQTHPVGLQCVPRSADPK